MSEPIAATRVTEVRMSAKSFWNAFLGESMGLAQRFIAEEARPVFDEFERLLERHGVDYCFNITADDKDCLLIFSPEGDASLAMEIDSFVRAAPPIACWKVFGRRLKKDVSDVAAIIEHLYRIELQQCRFRCSMRDGMCMVEVFIPDSSDLTVEEQAGFADTLLWHAVGEGEVMKHGIQSLVHVGDPDNAATLSVEQLIDQIADLYA